MCLLTGLLLLLSLHVGLNCVRISDTILCVSCGTVDENSVESVSDLIKDNKKKKKFFFGVTYTIFDNMSFESTITHLFVKLHSKISSIIDPYCVEIENKFNSLFSFIDAKLGIKDFFFILKISFNFFNPESTFIKEYFKPVFDSLTNYLE